ncbi:MerR family transcriptional regulator [Ferruginibacter albus]|uniref:MerR family transcriptional regulator n=1 Tax=Ferruginibacter albus TaxID=2875540 RepID=UPI001CC45544|nr:MerR family transcriptional regulator [Ferruginibacter albus]UAY52214.1 MerR family transcriptional regulator [Ferruginibacter albus]
MDAYTIKDLENLSGVKAHTIRIWEQRYNFLKPCRTCTNIRYYSNEELKKLLNIALLNRNGFKISHINKMCETELKQKLLSLTQLEACYEKKINALVQAMIDLNTTELESILDKCIAADGIEKTATQIMFPFLLKIGILWQANEIIPAQQNLASNIIRKKIVLAIEGIPPVPPKNKTVLLFLPEGEHHELGLLFVSYLLKKQGVETIYLGSDIKLSDVEYIVKHKKPDYIYSHLTCVNPKFCFEKFVDAVAKNFPDTKIIISGKLTHSYEKRTPSSIKFKRSFDEIVEFSTTL